MASTSLAPGNGAASPTRDQSHGHSRWLDYSDPEELERWLEADKAREFGEVWPDDDDDEADPAPPANDTAPPLWSDLLGAFDGVGRERDWFAEGAIEGDPMILFSGPEKSHKSWTAMQLAVATVVGGAWLGRFQVKRPGSVVYLDGEYGEHEFTRRVARIARGMGVEPREVLERIRHLYSADLMLTKGDATLKLVLAEVTADPPALIVLDPLRNHLAGDENMAQVIVEAFRSLSALRGAGSCPLLAIHHLNKSGGFSGSRATTTRADLIIEGSDAETPTYKVRARTMRRTDAITVPFTIEVSHEHDDDDSIASTRLMHTVDGGDGLPPGLTSPQRKIVEFLSKQTELRTTNYIAKAVKQNPSVTARELTGLVVVGHVELVLGGVLFGTKCFDGYRIGTGKPPKAETTEEEDDGHRLRPSGEDPTKGPYSEVPTGRDNNAPTIAEGDDGK